MVNIAEVCIRRQTIKDVGSYYSSPLWGKIVYNSGDPISKRLLNGWRKFRGENEDNTRIWGLVDETLVCSSEDDLSDTL